MRTLHLFCWRNVSPCGLLLHFIPPEVTRMMCEWMVYCTWANSRIRIILQRTSHRKRFTPLKCFLWNSALFLQELLFFRPSGMGASLRWNSGDVVLKRPHGYHHNAQPMSENSCCVGASSWTSARCKHGSMGTRTSPPCTLGQRTTSFPSSPLAGMATFF